jgi:tRNA pseudouridine38-40 synthase
MSLPRRDFFRHIRGVDIVKIRLTVAFDGARYAGWQTQESGLAVQQVMEEVLARFFPSKPTLYSSSRTDAGVHALAMVAHFEVSRSELRMPASKMLLALNAYLPEDIRVMSVARAKPDFHARFHAKGKQYRYYVWNHRAMNPLLRNSAWQVPLPLDLKSMREAAKLFLGKRDFKSFAATHPYPKENTVRTLRRCEIKKQGPLLTFIIEGDGFLYKMCRGIVGTLVQLGRGRFTAGDIKEIFEAKDRTKAGMSAPAKGLVLWKVYYK